MVQCYEFLPCFEVNNEYDVKFGVIVEYIRNPLSFRLNSRYSAFELNRFDVFYGFLRTTLLQCRSHGLR